jgi:hypothetical protein
MKFVKLTEENEWEGETWRFWLQVDGNEDALLRLHVALDALAALYRDGEPGSPFVLDSIDHAKDESYVDVLIEQADEEEGGYMASDHKVTGVLRVPDWPAPTDFGGRIEQDLNKGGVCELFQETAPA